MPSLSTTQVKSSTGADEAGRTSLFLRVPLTLSDVFCQPPAPPPLQDKLQSLSHSLAQVSTQVKVRSSSPDSALTVWTHIRGDVEGGRSRAQFWVWTRVLTLTLQGLQSDPVEDPLLVSGVRTPVLCSMEDTDLSKGQRRGASAQHLPAHSPLHATTRAKSGSVVTGK